MTLGEKIRTLREDHGMLQRELAALLRIGDTFLSKVESNRKCLSRSHLTVISQVFQYPLKELEVLWVANKVYDLVKDEKEGLQALRVAEKQIKYKNG